MRGPARLALVPKECLSPDANRSRQCAAVSLTRRRRSRAYVRVSPPLLLSSPIFSPPLVAAVRATSPRRRSSPRCRSASLRRAAPLVFAAPPLVDAIPHRVAPLVAVTPLVTTAPLSRRTPLLSHLSSPRCHTSPLRRSSPLLATPLLSSMPHLLAAAPSSSTPASPPAPLVLRVSAACAAYVHMLCVGLTVTVCAFGERCKRFAVRVS